MRKKIDEKICERQNNLQEIRLKKKNTSCRNYYVLCVLFSLCNSTNSVQAPHIVYMLLVFRFTIADWKLKRPSSCIFSISKNVVWYTKKKTLAWMKWVNEARQQCASTSETTQSSSHFVYNFTVKRVIVKTERWVKSPCRWLLRFLFLAIDRLSLSLFVHSKTFS